MICYVVCAESAWDSYHALILVTLNKTEAEQAVEKHNTKHDPECITETFFNCGCIRYHLHSVPLKGWGKKVRKLIKIARRFPSKPLDKPANNVLE